jgi:hypothetical protein
MPARSLDAVFFSDQIPDMFIKDGMFHIAYTVGTVHAEFVLPPRVFLAGLVKCNEVARELGRSADIISVAFESKFERVYRDDKSA